MATKRKVSVIFCFPSYGGNGGIQSEVPNIRNWYADTITKIDKDDRISTRHEITVGDTPITYVRNMFVMEARRVGADFMVQVDSDMWPDRQLGHPQTKPFWDSSFDYLYHHYDKGPAVVFAPYGGPPPVENNYCFRWDSDGYQGDETIIRIEPYSRHEAAKMRGFQECAAGPTGLIMYDMRCFDLIEPSTKSPEQILEEYKNGVISQREAIRCLTTKGWFDYEWTDQTMSKKASTEDVVNLRNISLAGMAKYGYNPVLCNWDAPAGHWKPWCVEGRPRIWDVKQISETFRRVVETNSRTDEIVVNPKHFPSHDFWERYEQIHGSNDNGPPDKIDGVNDHQPLPQESGTLLLGEVIPPDHKTPQEHLDALTEFMKTRAAEVAPSNLHVVEVGSWKGDSAIAILKAADNILLRCVDTWEGSPSDWTGELAKNEDVRQAFLNRIGMSGYHSRVKIIQGKSVDAAKFSDDLVDVVFLDADHSYESVKSDISAWWLRLQPNGWMIGHDYLVQQFPGVTKAVEEAFPYLKQKDLVYSYTNSGGFWKVHKANVTSELV